MKKKVIGPLNHIKKAAKRIKKNYPHIGLMMVQHDLANYLGFSKWGKLLEADNKTLQTRLNKKPIDELSRQ